MAELDVSFAIAFQDTINVLSQEDPDGIRGTVRVRNITAKADTWERLGGVELIQSTTRFEATPRTAMSHTRRRTTLLDYKGAEYLDPLDEVKTLINPKNEYTQNLVKAWHRRVARTITDAADAAATTVANDDTTSTAALPASQVIANGGTGLTMAKLRQANRLLDNAGVPRDGQRTLLTSAYGIEDLLSDSTITSSDFTQLNAITTGTVNGATVMGMKLIMISDAIPDETAVLTGGTLNPILPKTGNIRTCFLYHKSAIGLSLAMELRTSVSIRHDLSDAWQVLVMGSLGAVRIFDAGVVTIDIDES